MIKKRGEKRRIEERVRGDRCDSIRTSQKREWRRNQGTEKRDMN